MKVEELIKSAELLPDVSKESIEAYENKTEIMVAEVNSEMLKRADIKELVGEKNIDLMKNNHSNHARFVISILSHPNPTQLIETVSWVFRAYKSRGFQSSYWAAQLNTWIQVIKNNLNDDSFKEIYPLYNWFIVNIPSFDD